ncbi:MAG: NADH:ubiquinone oxidoreductase [Desulfobacterales bacterium]
MPSTLYWMQCGGCCGDTHALINAHSPDFFELLDLLDIQLLWHPSLSNGSANEHHELIERMLSCEQQIDILCVEGAVIRGPSGTGMFETMEGRPKKNVLSGLCARAKFVIAVGTCACFGGISAECKIEASGLQFFKRSKGGFLGESYRSQKGLPVINLPGCPCHPSILTGTFTALVHNKPLPLNTYNSPLEWYGLLVHQGCTRNEYHEYRVEDSIFGEKGCMFFHLGCRGPLAFGSCNKILWNRRSSKTRVGVPCFGCTLPDFPQSTPFYETPNIEGIPDELPDGVDRAHYIAYKAMAAAAAPERLKKRETEV